VTLTSGVCKDCGAPFYWGRRPGGSWFPLTEHPRGNVVLDAKGFSGPTEPGDTPDLTRRFLRHGIVCTMSRHTRVTNEVA
jgi:hypothetical protein